MFYFVDMAARLFFDLENEITSNLRSPLTSGRFLHLQLALSSTLLLLGCSPG